MEEVRLKIRENIRTTPIEVKTSSSDVADEKQFFFSQADNENESEEQTLQGEEKSRQDAKEWAAIEEISSLETSVEEFTKVDRNTASYSMIGIKANAQTRVEQYVDLVLKNLRLKTLGQPYAEVLLTTDRRYKHDKANEDRVTLRHDLLFRK